MLVCSDWAGSFLAGSSVSPAPNGTLIHPKADEAHGTSYVLTERCTRPDGSEAKCVLVSAQPVNTVVWYLNDVVQGFREFDDMAEACHWAVSTLWTALPMPERCQH